MNDHETLLQGYRVEIDGLDEMLIRCLAARFELSDRIASVKAAAQAAIHQPERAKQVAQQFQRTGAAHGVNPRFLEGLFGLVHAESCRRQRLCLTSRNWHRIGYLGPSGTFSEEAALGLQHRLTLDTAELVPLPSIEAVVKAADAGSVDAAVVPVENRLCGPVQRTLSALQDAPLFTWDEWWMPVAQSLLACGGAQSSDIREVWSAAPALAQCAQWIAARNLRTRVFDSTAGAAKAVAESRRKDIAAIGSPRIADIVGLVVLQAEVADQQDNATCFAAIAHKPEPRT